MTNYASWDSKATALVRDAEEDDKQAKAENNAALGLDGVPKGPPTEKAEKELDELGQHSAEKKEFIDWHKKREVTRTHKHCNLKDREKIMLEGEEVKGMAVRICGSENVTYVIPAEGLVKLNVDDCKNVTVEVLAPFLTSTIEAFRCDNVDFQLRVPIGTFQVDDCLKDVTINYAERDHVGQIYHQNSPGLFVGCGDKVIQVGKSLRSDVQYFTRLAATSDSSPFLTDVVIRGEGEFPINLTDEARARGAGYSRGAEQPEPEAAPETEERKRKAELKRLAGNEMFRANDFLQAAMEYTSALELDPMLSPLYANRSQCWMKLGNLEKALEDATKCTEVDPANPKGWFRRGMSLHGMKRYAEAIPHLLEAEKLEPTNKQVQEAIKMAQLFARKEAAGA